MAQLNDCKFVALRTLGHTGAIGDMMRQWAQANGGTSNGVGLATLQALQTNGASSNNLDVAWREALVLLGIAIGNRNGMEKKFWCSYGGVFGEIILNELGWDATDAVGWTATDSIRS